MPHVAYPVFMPRGRVEREVRNKGCGLFVCIAPWRQSMPQVTVTKKEVWNKEEQHSSKGFILLTLGVSQRE